MIALTIDSLHKHLQEKNLSPEIQKETHQIYVIFKYGGKEFPLFFRIFEEHGLLQLITFIPSNLKAECVGDLARLLHYLNKELDIPGFCFDEAAGLVFYRVMIPAPNKEIDPKILDAYIQSVQTVCQTFAPVIAAVSTGMSSFDSVLKLVKESQEKEAKQDKN